MLQLLDTLIDQQLETREISSETLATVRPLTSLLDLLVRPQDQSTELGKQLAETLSQLAFSANATTHKVADLTAQVTAMAARLDGITTTLTQMQDGQKKLTTTLSAAGPQDGSAHPRPVRGPASLGRRLSQVLAVLRQTGLHARPRIRRRDRSIGVSFTDGSAVRVTSGCSHSGEGGASQGRHVRAVRAGLCQAAQLDRQHGRQRMAVSGARSSPACRWPARRRRCAGTLPGAFTPPR